MSGLGPSGSATGAAPSEAQLTKQYGKGFNMLKKMGFQAGKGLGPSGEGIINPIEISMRRTGEGLQDDEGKSARRASATSRVKRAPKTSGDATRRGPMEGSDEESEEWPGESDDESDIVPARERTAEDRALHEASQLVEKLADEAKSLDYQLYALKAEAAERTSGFSTESIDELVRDVIDSGVLTSGSSTVELLRKYIDIMRDKYDSNPLWYALDVEAVITGAVSQAISTQLETDELSAALIEQTREMILDDDAFTRVLEFQLLPPLALTPDLSIFTCIKKVATPLHYDSIYSRFVEPFLIRSLTSSRREPSWLITDGWLDLVPIGHFLHSILINYVKPRLTTSASPDEVIPWRSLFSAEEWRDIVQRITNRVSQSLRKLTPTATNETLAIIKIAVEWQSVVSPCVVGLLLVDSGFLPKWFETAKLRPDFKSVCLQWLPVLAAVAYHTPARKILLDCVRIVRGEPLGANVRRRPGGPPPEFFAARTTTQVPVGGDAEKVTLGDVVKEEAQRRGVAVTPSPGARENGCQVFRVGSKLVYWKEDSLFVKPGEAPWAEVALDSVFK